MGIEANTNYPISNSLSTPHQLRFKGIGIASAFS